MNERISQKQMNQEYEVGIDTVIRVVHARLKQSCGSDAVFIAPNIPEGSLLSDGSVAVDNRLII